MRLQVAAQGFPVADVVKTRLLLEAAIGTVLAEVGTGLGPATTLLDAMGSEELTPAEFLALDARFHVALAEASGNQVVTAMMVGLRSAIEAYVTACLPAVADWNAITKLTEQDHR